MTISLRPAGRQPLSARQTGWGRRTDGGVLAPDVVDHDRGHEERDDVHEARRWGCVSGARKNGAARARTRLEDEGAADVDVARVADGLDALRPEQRAHDERGRRAHAVERAERDRHGRGARAEEEEEGNGRRR
jgi:hypothetical protein